MTIEKLVNIAPIALTPSSAGPIHLLCYFSFALKLALHHSFSGLMLLASPASNTTVIKACRYRTV